MFFLWLYSHGIHGIDHLESDTLQIFLTQTVLLSLFLIGEAF